MTAIEEFCLDTEVLKNSLDDIDNVKKALTEASKGLDKAILGYMETITYELIGGGHYTLYYGAAKDRIKKRINLLINKFDKYQLNLQNFVDVYEEYEKSEEIGSEDESITSEETLSDTASTPTPGKEYTIKKGDTLWDMAIKAYGDGTKWTLIRDANPGIEATKLVIGVNLLIPLDSTDLGISKTEKAAPVNVVNPGTDSEKEATTVEEDAKKITKVAEVIDIAEAAFPATAAATTAAATTQKAEEETTTKPVEGTTNEADEAAPIDVVNPGSEMVEDNKEYYIPSGNTSPKAYESYRAISNRDTLNYAIAHGTTYNGVTYNTQTEAGTGLRYVTINGEKFYCVATGSYYGKVGELFQVTTDTGNIINVIKTDGKKASDSTAVLYPNSGLSVGHTFGSGTCIIEMVVDGSNAEYPSSGSYNEVQGFSGNITSIEKIGNTQ